jgi:serine/threonine-protein kinase
LLALLVAAAAAAAVYLLTAPSQTTVPAVVGRQVSAATTTLKRAGFKVTIRHARSTRAAGIVLRQDPSSGSQANQGSTVHLTVSAGPGSVTVPQVQGKPLNQAESIIRHHGLKVGKVQYVQNSAVVAGDVSSTSPFAGQPVAPGTTVKLFVSSGPATKNVPDVTGESEATARATLQSAGFSVTATIRTTTSAPAGTVVGQNPQGGTQATPGSTVIIIVAQKPPPPAEVTVPSVTGQSEAQAKSALSAAGFNVSVTTQTTKSKSKNGIVLSQTPAGGTKAKKGTAVTIVVGSYKQTTTPTTPTTTPTTPSGGGGGGGGSGGSGGSGGGGGAGGLARVP